MLKRLMTAWEHALMRRDTNRRVWPFEWGLEHLGLSAQQDAPEQVLQAFVDQAVASSDAFYQPPHQTDFIYRDGQLTFPSPIQSAYPENNVAYGQFFPAASTRRAVIVLPQWNAQSDSHVGLCRLLNYVGIAALRLTMPYHEHRRPAHLERADYMIGPNLGRTIQACRQAVQETRLAATWLQQQGYRALGLIGTSIGSCIAFLTFAHDERFQVGVFNHASSFFADVVWQGLTTQHVRQSLQQHISLEQLRRYWSLISPQTFVPRLQGTTRQSLMIWARYDLSFPPYLTHLFFDELRRWNVPFDTATLPCGHYTTGVTPFKYMDGFLIARYFRKHLR
ncbi:MAG: abhydrolase domain-containing 18 [Acidobacteriota bacterium]|nr:abhydrolase domain-containing 18 [Blastocatellia bacterium]MDW8239599.1 abhydrolase domain-containing 18 [Acidobacteriota bacterium]